jgi:hypothetical protein
MPINEFFERFIQHIPDKYFKMTRYYGLFANAVRGKTLPKVYKLLDQKIKDLKNITFQQLSILSFGHDPLKCIICGSQLMFSSLVIGKSSKDLIKFHTQLATNKRIPVISI